MACRERFSRPAVIMVTKYVKVWTSGRKTTLVLWVTGAILAIGNSLGGYLGATLSMQRGETLIRRILVLAVIAMIIKLVLFP